MHRRLKLNELADSILQSEKGKGSSVIMYRVIEKDNCILEPQLVDCCLNNSAKYIKYWYKDASFLQQTNILCFFFVILNIWILDNNGLGLKRIDCLSIYFFT